VHHPVFSLLVAFLLGLILGERVAVTAWFVWVGFLVFLGLSAVFFQRRRRSASQVALLIAFMLGGVLRLRLASIDLDPLHYAHAGSKINGTFKIVLDAHPHLQGDRVVLYGELSQFSDRSQRRGMTGRIRLEPHPKDPLVTDLKIGDVLEVRGRIVQTGLVVPWKKTPSDWDRRRGVLGILKCRNFVKVVGYKALTPWSAAALAARHRILKMLEQTHPPEVTEFIQAILLSSRQLDASIQENFRLSGAYHLLAVSGLHVGILTLVLYGILGGLPLPRRFVSLLVLCCLAMYCTMVGATTSAVRATLMVGIFLVGRVLDRPISAYASLSAAAFILLLHDPTLIQDPGFQLTFLTSLGILYLTPVLMARLDFIPGYLGALLATSLAATLGALPVMVDAFGLVVLVGPLTNLVAIPLFGVILPIAFLACLGSLISPWISFFFGAANYGFINLLFHVNQVFASIPYGHVEVDPKGLTFWSLYGFGLVVFGDFANLKAALRPILIRTVPAPVPAVTEGIPTAILERTTRELDSLVPTGEGESDPLFQKLARVRADLLTQIPHLSAEFIQEYNDLMRKPWRGALDSLTLAYLAFSGAHFVASRSQDKRPSLVYLLVAIQHELNIHLFAPMRSSATILRAQGLKDAYPTHGLVKFLLEPPVPLTLKRQNELLWTMITTTDPRLQRLVRSITKDLSRRFVDVSFFFSPAELPLRLDQIVKKFHDRLDKVDWGWESVRLAREEIIGPKASHLFEDIGNASGTRGTVSESWLNGVATLQAEEEIKTPRIDAESVRTRTGSE